MRTYKTDEFVEVEQKILRGAIILLIGFALGIVVACEVIGAL